LSRKDHLEEGRKLFAARRWKDAAKAYLRAIPEDWHPRLGADQTTRQALKQASVAYAQGGDVDRCVALLLAIEERPRAAQVLERAGREAEARRIRRGGDVDLQPWARGARVGGAADPLARADAYVRAGEPSRALEALTKVESSDNRFTAAARRAAQIAGRTGRLTFELDHWIGPWVRRVHAPHVAADAAPLYALGGLYATHGQIESAEECWSAVLALDPTYGDVKDRLKRLWREDRAADSVLQKIAEEERSFHTDKRGFGSVGGFHEPVTLPSLPSLPSLPALPPVDDPHAPAKPERRKKKQEVDPFIDSATEQETATQLMPLGGDKRMRPPAGTVDAKSLPAGTLVADRYEIGAKLGQGGMGVVYRVRDSMLDEDVAMKLFFKAGMSDLARFKEELKICRRLSHPNVLRTFEFGAWGGAHFLTMELLDGCDLDALLEATGSLPLQGGIRLMMQACDGLGAAHRLGIIHRDVKPQNLFVSADGNRLKIMDFGIAKSQRSSVSLTTTGELVGSPAYIAPERIRGDADVTVSGDLYALGVVMYQTFTGRLPFRGQNVAAMLMQHLEATPDRPSSLNPKVTPELEDVILRLLAKDPEARHAHARAVKSALEHAWRLT